MTCGICKYTDGCCYTSLPPKVRCNITGEFHYYDDECNCEDIKERKAEEFDNIRELIGEPGALMALNYDGHNAPSVSFVNTLDGHITSAEIDMASNAATAIGCADCLVCGESITVNMFDSYTKICPTCKKAIMYIREKFTKELETYEVQ